MHKKSLSRSLQSSTSLGLSVLALGALLTGCGSSATEDTSCPSSDGLWKFPTCMTSGPYEYVGPAGMPCTTPDNRYFRSDCANTATQVEVGGVNNQPCVSADGLWKFPTCQATSYEYVGPAGVPCTTPDGLFTRSDCANVATQVAIVTPVTPGNTAVTPGNTAVTPGNTAVTPGNTAVTPGNTAVTPGNTAVTPGNTAVTPVTPVTPGVTPVTPGTEPVTPVTPGGDPLGYWRQDDWKGCAWTGIDDQGAGTSIAPQDFTGGTPEGGYCVAGNVAATEGWLGVALLGFNLNQDPATADCNYVPVDVNAEGPPAVTVTKKGLAIDFVKRGDDKTFTLRAQIQGPNGASDPNDRWCANITEAQGKELIEWNTFNTECWEGGEGNDYSGEPISAVVFTVPGNGWAEGENGTADDVPYDFCINGLAAGDTPEDAPDGNIEQEDLTGVIGGDATGADYERVKVSAGGESYVIQNNNWGGDINTSSQSISFVNNSFTVTDGPDGAATCQGCPLSFPSIYIGASGNTDLGKYHTRSTDNLPAAIGDITAVNTSVTWSGNPGGASNAAYDIWFASPSRGDLEGQRYNDGLDGFIMLWLYDPNGQSAPMPIGGSPVETKTIAGSSWQVWVGPRGAGPSGEGADLQADQAAPVISYVATSTMNSFNGDLKPFFDDAVNRSGGGSKPFGADFLLTDVFFGFEIWNSVSGLKVDNFSVEVQK
jgi:hypothetical protein